MKSKYGYNPGDIVLVSFNNEECIITLKSILYMNDDSFVGKHNSAALWNYYVFKGKDIFDDKSPLSEGYFIKKINTKNSRVIKWL